MSVSDIHSGIVCLSCHGDHNQPVNLSPLHLPSCWKSCPTWFAFYQSAELELSCPTCLRHIHAYTPPPVTPAVHLTTPHCTAALYCLLVNQLFHRDWKLKTGSRRNQKGIHRKACLWMNAKCLVSAMPLHPEFLPDCGPTSRCLRHLCRECLHNLSDQFPWPVHSWSYVFVTAKSSTRSHIHARPGHSLILQPLSHMHCTASFCDTNSARGLLVVWYI